jgi:hypothetical protein
VVFGLFGRVVGQWWLLVVVGCVQPVVMVDFATDAPGKGVGHHLGSYMSAGRENVSW